MGASSGPYEVQGELGRGGMGVVSRALDTKLGRTVALKALPGEVAADPLRLERFEREARLLAQLSHPNLAGIHGVEEHEASPWPSGAIAGRCRWKRRSTSPSRSLRASRRRTRRA